MKLQQQSGYLLNIKMLVKIIFKNIFGQNIWKIFLLSLVLRLFSIFFIVDYDSLQLWEYGMIAENILQGNGYSLSYIPGTPSPTLPNGDSITVPSAFMPPIYVGILSLFLFISGNNYFTYLLILIIQSIAGAIGVVIIYHLTKRIFPEQVAIISAYVCALYPPFLIANGDFGPTTLYMTFLGLLLLMIIHIKQNNSKIMCLLGGLVAGIIALTRGEGILIVLGFSLWMLFNIHISRVLIFVFTGMLIILPWFVRNYYVLEGFVPITTSAGLNFWRGNNSLATGTSRNLSGEGIWINASVDSQVKALSVSPRYEIEYSRIFLNDAISFIENNAYREVGLMFKKIFYFWFLDITHPKSRRIEYIVSWGTILFFFVVGMVIVPKFHYDIGILLVFLISMTAVAMVFFVLPRYQIILTYGMIPVSSAGISYIYDSIFQGKTEE